MKCAVILQSDYGYGYNMSAEHWQSTYSSTYDSYQGQYSDQQVSSFVKKAFKAKCTFRTQKQCGQCRVKFAFPESL